MTLFFGICFTLHLSVYVVDGEFWKAFKAFKAAKLVLGAPPLFSPTEALKTLNWTPLGIRRQKHRGIFIFKCYNGLIDSDFKLTRNNSIHNHYTRTNRNTKANTNWGKQKVIYHASKDFNNLDKKKQTPTL